MHWSRNANGSTNTAPRPRVFPRDLPYEFNKRREACVRWVAWHLPSELVMWCYMRVAAHATTGEHADTNVCELSMMDAIKRWPA